MFTIARGVQLAATLFAFCAAGFAAEAPSRAGWVRSFSAARHACQIGEFAPATAIYTELIASLKAASGPEDLLARAYEERAVSLKVSGRVDEAEKDYLRALTLMEGIDGHQGERVGLILSDLGALYIETGQLSRSEHYLIEARSLFSSSTGVRGYIKASALQNLGALYYHQSQFQKAEAKFREAVDVLRTESPDERPQFAVVLGDLAQTLMSEGNSDEALKLIKQSLQMFEDFRGQYPSNHYGALVTAVLLEKSVGDLPAAERTCERALQIGNQVLGETNPRLVPALQLCSLVYKAQRRKKEGKELAGRAAEIQNEINTRSSGSKTIDLASLLQKSR